MPKETSQTPKSLLAFLLSYNGEFIELTYNRLAKAFGEVVEEDGIDGSALILRKITVPTTIRV